MKFYFEQDKYYKIRTSFQSFFAKKCKTIWENFSRLLQLLELCIYKDTRPCKNFFPKKSSIVHLQDCCWKDKFLSDFKRFKRRDFLQPDMLWKDFLFQFDKNFVRTINSLQNLSFVRSVIDSLLTSAGQQFFHKTIFFFHQVTS